MKKLLLLILISFTIQISKAEKAPIIKSQKIKFGRSCPVSKKPFVFEDNKFTYFADAAYRHQGNRLVFNLARLDKSLKVKGKIKIKYPNNENIQNAGFRHLKTSNILCFYYVQHSEESSKIYCQKINLNTFKKISSPKMIINFKSKDEDYKRKPECYSSPNGKYTLIAFRGIKTQAQYLFDENENLIYQKDYNLLGANLSVTNKGWVIGIIDNFKTFSLFKLTEPENYNNFSIISMDLNGEINQENYKPNTNPYYKSRTWNSTVMRSNFVVQSFNSTNQCSYKFVVKDNFMYFVSFFSNDKTGYSGTNKSNLSKGIYIEKLGIEDTFALLNQKSYFFTKKQTNEVLNQIFSAKEETQAQRIKEFQNLSKEGVANTPCIYIDDVYIDNNDNISVFGSTYTNFDENIYVDPKEEPASNKTNSSTKYFEYNRRNYHFFRIDNINGLNENVGTATMNFHENMFLDNSGFAKTQDPNSYTVKNRYTNLNLELGKVEHDHSKTRLQFQIEDFYFHSSSGQLYGVNTKNLDVNAHLYRLGY